MQNKDATCTFRRLVSVTAGTTPTVDSVTSANQVTGTFLAASNARYYNGTIIEYKYFL